MNFNIKTILLLRKQYEDIDQKAGKMGEQWPSPAGN